MKKRYSQQRQQQQHQNRKRRFRNAKPLMGSPALAVKKLPSWQPDDDRPEERASEINPRHPSQSQLQPQLHEGSSLTCAKGQYESSASLDVFGVVPPTSSTSQSSSSSLVLLNRYFSLDELTTLVTTTTTTNITTTGKNKVVAQRGENTPVFEADDDDDDDDDGIVASLLSWKASTTTGAKAGHSSPSPKDVKKKDIEMQNQETEDSDRPAEPTNREKSLASPTLQTIVLQQQQQQQQQLPLSKPTMFSTIKYHHHHHCDLYEEGLQTIAPLVQHEKDHHTNESIPQPGEEITTTTTTTTASEIMKETIPPMKPPETFDVRLLQTKDSKVMWSYDPQYRVVRADFTNHNHTNTSNGEPPCPADLAKLAYLMQRDDLTIISKGLTMHLHNINELQNFLSYLESDERKYYKFRRYQRNTTTTTGDCGNKNNTNSTFGEVDGHVEMTPREYVKYLKQRMVLLQTQMDVDHHHTNDNMIVEFRVDGTSKSERVQDILLYMVDADIPQLYPQLDKEYVEHCLWPDILPGGALCMMGELPKQMQPFMGPNLYLTPGGTFTSLHQDGFGSVDSGHSNVYGTNEVVLLRRLPEYHKRNACRMVLVPQCTTTTQYDSSNNDVLVLQQQQAASSAAVAGTENILYGMPHDDGRKERQEWPTSATIQEWERLNYCPSVFLLMAGEHLHINKGRLHAFRKMTNESLPENDCHCDLREHHLRTNPIIDSSDICVSIAFDWMYLGFEAAAINREIVTVLEAAYRIRTRKAAKTLAVGETAVFSLAEAAVANGRILSSSSWMRKLRPSSKAIARGILCALTFLVDRDTNCGNNNSTDDDSCIQVDADQDPGSRTVDPFGNDYFCKLCDHELANTYYHCQGCENLLQMDFNICYYCFRDGKYHCDVDMKPYVNDPKGCHEHHNGGSFVMRCTSTNEECSCCEDVCDACICSCHHTFTKHHRFRSDEKARKLLQDCKALSGGDEMIPDGYFETIQRLQDGMDGATSSVGCCYATAPRVTGEEGMTLKTRMQDNSIARVPTKRHGERVLDLEIVPDVNQSVFDREITHRDQCIYVDQDACTFVAIIKDYGSDTNGAPV